MIPEPTGMTCAFPGCHVKLNMTTKEWKDGRREVSWMHGVTPEDVPYHDPVPVPETELKATLVCDFCGDLNPQWYLGCPAFQEQFTQGGDGSVQEAIVNSGEGWAACQECKELLDEGDITAVTDRAVMASELRGHLSRLNRADRRKMKPHVWRDMHEAHQNFARMRNYDDWSLLDAIDKERQVRAMRSLFEP